MEPHDRAAQALTASSGNVAAAPRGSAVTAVRLGVVCVLLVALAFTQAPGFLVADTKFDLVLDPARFLQRASHLWDSQGAFGQLQNQAYGYLWPMGPFFLLGSAVDLPGWVVQRLWMGTVLGVAFVGSARVTRVLGVRSDLACIVASLAYALSPRMLSTLGPISIEAWPSALAPWVLLPLIRGSVHGSTRRAAAFSALAVAMVGGVNAAATFAVLPLGVVWLLTRAPGPRRRSLMLWWPLFTALGTLWWLVPLFVMGAYSPPFLDFIETASITTFPTTLFDALRGTSAWVPYIDSSWRAGNDLITHFYLPLNSGVVLMLGFAGLMYRRNEHRQFLVLSVLTGLVMVTMGHLGSVQGWFASDLHEALDGALAPLRNVHKFDPIIRLPLVVGLGWTLQWGHERLAERARRHARPTGVRGRSAPSILDLGNPAAVLALAVAVVAGAAAPAFVGRITPSGATLGIPDYWRQTARWLQNQPGDATALLLPGSGSATYVWGSPRDEPLQAFAGSRWAVRNGIPLTPPGNIRMLDEIESRVAQGKGSAGLTSYLRRAGVGYLVVRNDLAHSDDIPDTVLVHQALSTSPGISRVRTFGPTVGGAGHVERAGRRVLVNGGWQDTNPAVEIYRVGAQRGPARNGEPAPVVAGGPEDLLDLADLGVVDDQPTTLAADVARDPDGRVPVILTDGLRARERFFGRVHDSASSMITAGDRRRTGNPVSDYGLTNGHRWSTTTRLEGISAVAASSSASDAVAIGGAVQGEMPFAAVDGTVDTSWVSDRGQDDPAFWKVTFSAPTEVTELTLVGGSEAPAGQTVRVRTQRGVSRVLELDSGETQVVRVPQGPSSWLRVEDASKVAGGLLSLAEVRIPGVSARRALVLPKLPARWGNPDSVVLRALRDGRTGCVRIAADVRCVPGRDRPSEEEQGIDRVVDLPASGRYRPSLRVLPRAGVPLGELIQRDLPIGANASSTSVRDIRGSALSAVDGKPGTTWTADVGDLRPSLQLRWLGERSVSGLAVSVDADAAARRPERVILVWPGGRRVVSLDEDGRASFPSIRTDQLTLRVDTAEDAVSLGYDRTSASVPVGISELRLVGVPYLPISLPSTPVRHPCGSGPEVRIGRQVLESSVTARPGQLLGTEPLDAELCRTDSLALVSGENDIRVRNAPAFAVASMMLTSTNDPSTGPVASTDAVTGAVVQADSPVRRTVLPRPEAQVVTTYENVNPGWTASRGGESLRPVVVDGWQQGFEPGDRTGPVMVVFAPDRTYRWGLGAGLVAFLVLVAMCLVPDRRREVDAWPSVRAREMSTPLLASVGLLGAGLLSGWAGVAISVAGCAGALAVDRRAPGVTRWLFSAAALLASVAYVFRPWGSTSGWAGGSAWPHYVVLLPLAATFALAASSPLRGRHRLRRMAGFSTRR